MSEILRIEQLSIYPAHAPERKLVHHVSLTLARGKTTCIVGESGSGKSLTALSVMKLLSPQLRMQGRILFQGQDITQFDEPAMQRLRGRHMGMIFQEPMTSLNPVLTVGYQIGEPLQTHLGLRGKALQQKIADLLQQVGIDPDRANSYPDELSGGQRQRVLIAMSIACEPALLIADEPTTALDVTVQAQVLRLLDALKDRMQMAMLFITHDFGVVADIADEVIVMFRGEIVEAGPVQQVLQQPQHPYTQALLACVPDAEGKKTLQPMTYDWLTTA